MRISFGLQDTDRRVHAAERKQIDGNDQRPEYCRIHQGIKIRTTSEKHRKKGEGPNDKPLTILLNQPWDKSGQNLGIPQGLLRMTAMSFPPLREEEGTEGPMIIEVEMGGHFVHRVYVDGGASSEVLYEHCFIKLKEIRDRMVPATTHLIGFSGETIWPLGQIALLVKIGNEMHSTSAWMNFMVIRQLREKEIIRDITETFKTLRQINMKLNLKKCTFEMQEGMFLGYKVSTNGLRAMSDKADAGSSDLPSPRCIKDVQKLNGKLASLNRFLSKSAENIFPFQNLEKLHKKSDFQWTPEAEEAFKQMKKLIAELPTLTAPREREELIIYLAAAKEAISAVLMTDREGRQIPVYFVSRTLRGPEVNYTPMEKLVLALLSASKRLKRYFQAHTVVVITNQPIKQLLSSSEISGRMLKWKFELEGYDIQYRPRTAIKGQILADFIVERPEEESPDELMAEPEVLPEPWTLFTDGSSCVDGSGAGLILTNPEGAEFTYAMRFRFEATNNEAEYEALIAGLRIAEKMGIRNLQANVDSRLVANQVNGSFSCQESGMVQYLNKVKTLAKSFKEFSIKQIPRSENKKADALSKIASTSFAHLNKQVLVEELKEKSINEKEILDIVEEEGNTWMTPIQDYLTKEILPEDKKRARAVRRKAVSMHSGPRSVVAKVIQTGYYWPTMHMDARNLIRECNDCQIHRPVPRNPQQNLTPITSPWPFYKWGIDIAGPFRKDQDLATRGDHILTMRKQCRDKPFKDWCAETVHPSMLRSRENIASKWSY
ncbi:reverse transcriptase domain-containing protein [Tanacetum coccineum]